MMKKLSVFVLALSLASASWAAFIPDMKFRRLDTRDGLTSSQVNCILRDSRGFIWLATPFGLCRYDGYRIQTYFSYARDTMTLKSNRIDNIQEGYGGSLWINHGLSYSVFHPETEKVDRSPQTFLAKRGIEGSLESIHIDSKKNYWVKTYDHGFYFMNPHQKKVQHMNFGYGMAEFPKEFGVSACTETKDGMVMVSKQGELMCVDGEHGLVVWKDDHVAHMLNAYNDYWVYDDPQEDLLWVITHSVGTYILDHKTKHWYTTLTEMMRDKGFQNVPDDVVVWEVRRDRRGLLWVATDHLGLFVLDFKNKEWRAFVNDKNDASTIPDMTCKHLYEDPLGRMWVATYKNGVAMSSDAMQNFSSLPLGDINAVTEDKQGYWWLGMNTGGIKKVDPTTQEVVEEYTKQTIPVRNDVIVSAFTARDGSLWFGTWEGGAIQYKNGQWHNYLSTDKGSAMMSNNVWGVAEDRQGNIWLGMLGGGAVRIDKHNGAQRVFNEQNSRLKTVWTNSISLAPNGWMLLANSEYCALINPATGKVINLPLPEDANSYTISSASTQALMDSRGLIWQGSASGLTVFDRKAKRTKLLDMKSGFYGSNVVGLLEDPKTHAMWIVTEHGISNVTPQKEEGGWYTFAVRSYNDRDGLQPGPFNQRSACFTSKGFVLVGGQDGLDVINTRNLSNTGQKEAPLFSGLLIFDQEVGVGEEVNGHVILDEVLNQTDGITLRFNDQFTIQLGSTSGLINNGKRFVYKLEGFNDNWVKTAENNPNITYNSLRAGSYKLLVRMLNDDGTIGNEERELDITIRPPLYRTRWMLLLYMLIIAGIALLWRHRFIKQHREKQELADIRHRTEMGQWMARARQTLHKEVQTLRHRGQAVEEAEQAVEPEVVSAEMTDEEPIIVSEEKPLERIALNKEMVDIVPVVKQACKEFVAPDGKRFRLSCDSAVIEQQMFIDKERITQMVQILLTNAVRFSASNSRVQVTILQPAIDKVSILVADNGIGISDEVKPHVFEPAYNDYDNVQLPLLKQIVDGHNGTVKVEDNPGGGTVFTITLPVEHDEIPEAELID